MSKDKHRKNLLKLALYVYKHHKKLNFNMRTFLETNTFNENRAPRKNMVKEIYSCGTVACLAGHGPAAGLYGKDDEDWSRYTSRVFGVSSVFYGDGEWLFGPQWATIDNTAIGGAKRIFWFLLYGLPEDAEEQMQGTAPLCYEKII